MQWGPLLPKWGGMIQKDIGGHPPIPLGPPPLFLFSFLFSLIVAQFINFGCFWVLNFWSRFEALNDVFWHRMVEKLLVHFGLNICCLWM